MNNTSFLIDCAIYIALATIFLLGLVVYNPRLMLQDYPPAIKTIVPPKTGQEKRLSTILGMPFLLALLVYPFFAAFRLDESSFWSLFLYAFGVVWSFRVMKPAGCSRKILRGV